MLLKFIVLFKKACRYIGFILHKTENVMNKNNIPAEALNELKTKLN